MNIHDFKPSLHHSFLPTQLWYFCLWMRPYIATPEKYFDYFLSHVQVASFTPSACFTCSQRETTFKFTYNKEKLSVKSLGHLRIRDMAYNTGKLVKWQNWLVSLANLRKEKLYSEPWRKDKGKTTELFFPRTHDISYIIKKMESEGSH